MTNDTSKVATLDDEVEMTGSVAHKILAIVSVLFILMVANAGFDIYVMGKIDKEFVQIAEHDLPLTNIVTRITVHQLEQAVAMERALRLGMEMKTDPAARRLFEQTVAHFEALTEKVDAEFVEVGEMVGKFIAEEESEAELKEFRNVQQALRVIAGAHAAYEYKSRKLLANLRMGNILAAHEAMEDVEADESALDKELEDLLIELEEFTLTSARMVEEHEKDAVLLMASISGIAAVVGFAGTFLLVGFVITRPLAVVTKALDALARGDMSVGVRVRGRDEIGRLARAFNVFKENMIEKDRLVVERDRERERTEQRLRQISASRTRFFAAVSHDLRQPLHALALRLPVLEDEAAGASSGEAITAIRNACDTMGALLDSLLDISKLDAGEVAPKIDRVPIADIFEHLATEFAPQVAAGRLTLRVAPTSAWGVSDAFLLLRILRNFLVNAIRHTPQGKVLLGVRRRAGRLRLEVWDTGAGITADHLPHIFEEFYQAETPASDRGGNLGLGLSIVERLARLLDHRVDVRSWPGKGTVFSVELPMAAKPAERETHGAALAWTRDLAGLRIVLIDDDAAVLRATESLFNNWGCSVVTADTVAGAVTRVAACGRVPELILADLQLSHGETGTQAIEAIRGAAGSPIPAIIITASIDPDLLGAAAESGCLVIRKPLGPERLKVAVEAVLPPAAGTAGQDTACDAPPPAIGNAAPANGCSARERI